jgi:hypothetical protein
VLLLPRVQNAQDKDLLAAHTVGHLIGLVWHDEFPRPRLLTRPPQARIDGQPVDGDPDIRKHFVRAARIILRDEGVDALEIALRWSGEGYLHSRLRGG